jgi:hypothetical protein
LIDVLQQLGIIVLLVMGASAGIAVLGLLMITRSIRNIRVPANADFFTTMRYVPLTLVVLLDLLDLGLDVFAAPVSWLVLDRMGMPNLRDKAAVEALLPFTGPIPTFTIAWFLSRTTGLGTDPAARAAAQHAAAQHRQRRFAERDYPYEYEYDPRRPRIIDAEIDD